MTFCLKSPIAVNWIVPGFCPLQKSSTSWISLASFSFVPWKAPIVMWGGMRLFTMKLSPVRSANAFTAVEIVSSASFVGCRETAYVIWGLGLGIAYFSLCKGLFQVDG